MALKNGAGERSRTLDLLITSQLLYQLSYTGTVFKKWWRMTGSNRRPSACKADALPAELILHGNAQRRPTLTGGNPQLPSALKSLTSVFGMGTGVTSLPLSLDWVFNFEDKIYYNNSDEFYKCFFNIEKVFLVPSKLDKSSLKAFTFIMVKSSID